MQLDLFEDSRDVMLRNDAISALLSRDATATTRALTRLETEYPDDPSLPRLTALQHRLALAIVAPLSRQTAGEVLHATDGIVPAAQQTLGASAEAWLAPLWVEMAEASRGLTFDANDEMVHAAPFLLRAGKWVDAIACLETIPSWRRQPVPLAWKITATARIAGVDALWPYIAELSWMASARAQSLMPRLQLSELTTLISSFDAEFEGESSIDDFAWFPAWLLIAHPRLAEALRKAETGAGRAPERCARLVLSLLALERQGRHADVLRARKKLRDAHACLFELYMRNRAVSVVR